MGFSSSSSSRGLSGCESAPNRVECARGGEGRVVECEGGEAVACGGGTVSAGMLLVRGCCCMLCCVEHALSCRGMASCVRVWLWVWSPSSICCCAAEGLGRAV